MTEPLPIREFREGVTFREFRTAATRHGWTVESILDRVGPNAFGGPVTSRYYESPRTYVTRVLRRGHTVDDAYVIPYRCLIGLYVEATRLPRAIRDATRRCACRCGSPVYGRQQFASSACRARAANIRDIDPSAGT